MNDNHLTDKHEQGHKDKQIKKQTKKWKIKISPIFFVSDNKDKQILRQTKNRKITTPKRKVTPDKELLGGFQTVRDNHLTEKWKIKISPNFF